MSSYSPFTNVWKITSSSITTKHTEQENQDPASLCPTAFLHNPASLSCMLSGPKPESYSCLYPLCLANRDCSTFGEVVNKWVSARKRSSFMPWFPYHLASSWEAGASTISHLIQCPGDLFTVSNNLFFLCTCFCLLTLSSHATIRKSLWQIGSNSLLTIGPENHV